MGIDFSGDRIDACAATLARPAGKASRSRLPSLRLEPRRDADTRPVRK
jgi:hypothetical protein